MKPEQIELGRHALGLPNRARKSYRNHFVCGPGHDDYSEWLQMVQDGNAVKFNGSPITGNDPVFRLTNQAAITCLEPNERLDKEDFEITGPGQRKRR